jgi:hypothetical protein
MTHSEVVHHLSIVVPMFNEKELARDLIFAVEDALSELQISLGVNC